MTCEYESLVDRITPEDHLAFSKLKVWSAAPQVNGHIRDVVLMGKLTRLSAAGKRAGIYAPARACRVYMAAGVI